MRLERTGSVVHVRRPTTGAWSYDSGSRNWARTPAAVEEVQHAWVQRYTSTELQHALSPTATSTRMRAADSVGTRRRGVCGAASQPRHATGRGDPPMATSMPARSQVPLSYRPTLARRAGR